MSRERWTSSVGFIFATVGSAVGIGNIWRFPYLVGQNGGGAFLLAYLLAVLALAVPLLILEFAIGRRYGTSAIASFARMGRRYRWVGVAIILLVGGILSYYLVIIGWGLGFFVRSVVGQPLDFPSFVQGWEAVVYFGVALALVAGTVALGIKRGIELANLLLMPLLILLVLVLAVYGLTLSGRDAGLEFYLKPDFALLTSPATWRDALGQAFFSVGVGMGVMLTYGSYLTRDTDIHTSALWVVFADTGIALLVGLMIFPMVFTFGFAPASGPELAFQTLPTAFGLLPLSRLWGALFFLLFVLAGFASAISMLEAATAPLMDGLRWKRRLAVLVVAVAVFVVGLPSALSYSGLDLRLGADRFLEVADANLGNLGVPMAALVGGLIMAWAASRRETVQEIDTAARWRVGRLVLFLSRYFVPGALLLSLTATVVSLLQ